MKIVREHIDWDDKLKDEEVIDDPDDYLPNRVRKLAPKKQTPNKTDGIH